MLALSQKLYTASASAFAIDYKGTRICHGCFEHGSESWQLQIVNALRLGERTRASSLLSDLVYRNHLSRADDFVYVLDFCARLPDPLFVLETWRIMDEKEIDMNNRCYLLIIRALCKGGYLEQAFNLVSSLGENPDIYHILPMYNNFLGACAQTHSMYHANNCLDLMELRMVGKNEVTYTELLKFAVLQQNLSAVHEIWKECTKCYNVSLVALRRFIWSFTRLGDLKSAYEALQQMVSLAIHGKFTISKNAQGKLFTSRLDIPIPSSSTSDLGLKNFSMANETSVPSVFENCKDMEKCANFGIMPKTQLSGSVTKVLRWSFNDVIHACAQTQNYGLSEKLMLQMQNLGVEPSCSTYDGFIRAVVFERGLRDGMKVLKLMEKNNLKPYDSTLATLSVSCSKDLELDLAELFLDQISQPRHSHPYNAFLEACDTMDQPERAVQILAKMKQLKLKPDIRTYELLFSLFGNVNAPYEEGNMLSQVDAAKRIHAIETDMIRNGIQHSYISTRNLLKALGTEGMIRELMHYLHVAENRFSRSNTFIGTPIYNTVLHSLVEAKESHMAIEIYKTMILCGYRPDIATYNIMIDCCSIIRCFKSACTLVSMMIRNGFYPQALTYTSLIKILLVYENFNEALNLLDQGCSEGIELDVLLFNTIIQAACEKGRMDIIELVVEQMHRERVPPDSSTCGYVFSAYVDNGYLTTAMEALQVLSMRMISEENDSTLEEKRALFEEDFILSEDLEAVDLRLVELFEDSKEDLAVALMNLRWSAIVGFPFSWLPNASQWAMRLSRTYALAKNKIDFKLNVRWRGLV
ncbi:hypothetical protein LguiA_033335 [Lonicera macranthoides]